MCEEQELEIASNDSDRSGKRRGLLEDERYNVPMSRKKQKAEMWKKQGGANNKMPTTSSVFVIPKH